MNRILLVISQNGRLVDDMTTESVDRKLSWIRSNPGNRAIIAIQTNTPDLVIIDSGTDKDSRVLTFVRSIKKQYPDLPVFLIAQKSSEALAIGALKAGVDDYYKSPFSVEELLNGIERKLPAHAHAGKTKLKNQILAAKLIGNSRPMQEIKELMARVAMVDSTVLITGETGTGKELAANIIHNNSARAHHPLVSVNCAALPDNLVESELFGYEKGAFTGAVALARGRFEQAGGGTFFLDEIGDMTPFAQSKILRVVEDKQISHLGGAKPIPIDFRLIAATNREPETLMEDGQFRDDLFYRLNVARVHMPSLREHREDIPLLVDYTINQLNQKFNCAIKGLTANAMNTLMQHDWPGNVRELMNLLEAAYINMPVGKIRFADLPEMFNRCLSACRHMEEDERTRVITALMDTNWNKSTAAQKLNWSRMTLYRKMVKHKIIEKRTC